MGVGVGVGGPPLACARGMVRRTNVAAMVLISRSSASTMMLPLKIRVDRKRGCCTRCWEESDGSGVGDCAGKSVFICPP